ncbi:MAG: dipeptidase PepV [Clostridium sp.]|nr:dipeptidase PepV [Clostridium sp.]
MDLNKQVDNLSEDLIKAVQKIIRVKSVEGEKKESMPYGEGPAKALETALEIAKSLGFEVHNVDNYVGYAEYGKGEEYVAALGHLDVVPEGEGWKYPPYAAEIHDGKIFGRGTLDDKGPIISSLYALKALVDSKAPLSKKIRIIFGTNEESGSSEIPHYLAKEKPPVAGFTPDAEYPLINGEKGITIFDVVKKFEDNGNGDYKIKYIRGGDKANMVPNYCEAGIEADLKSNIIDECNNFANRTGYALKAEEKGNIVVIKSNGFTAHGSTPEKGKNAIMQLLAFLGELDLGKSDATNVVNFFNKYVGLETDGESFGIGLSDKVSGKLTFNVGVVNIDEDSARFTLNIRYPVTNTYEDMIVPFKERLSEVKMDIENMMLEKPLYFPEDHKLVKVLRKVYEEQTGMDSTPFAIGGGTYAKSMPNIIGFGPIFPGKPDLDHQVDENIEIEDLILNAKIYAHTLYELAK